MLKVDKKVWDEFTTPEKMIQKEADLLDQYEKNGIGSILRLWESDEDFIVLGVSNKSTVEINEEECKKDGIPILKRCSGGGTVLQGPGCLNYSFILEQNSHEDLKDIQKSSCYIMRAIRDLLNEEFKEISIKGVSDLVYEGKKISGNAQRRKKTHLLFHGTVLYNYDIQKIQKYLKYPSRVPDYRDGRSHLDFCRNLPIEKVKLIELFLQNEIKHTTNKCTSTK